MSLAFAIPLFEADPFMTGLAVAAVVAGALVYLVRGARR